MFCTSDAVSRVSAAWPDDPVLIPGMLGKLNPPADDAVGVALPDDAPQPAIATTAPMETAPTRSLLMVIEFLAVVRQRSLRAESPPMITVELSHRAALPNRKNDFTLIQSKQ
jgi:hypothetical protein